MIAILTNRMDVIEVSSFTQDIAKGVILIMAVALAIDRTTYALIKQDDQRGDTAMKPSAKRRFGRREFEATALGSTSNTVQFPK